MLHVTVKESLGEIPFEMRQLEEMEQRMLDYFGLTGSDVDLYFTDDEEIRSLNKRYRERDKATDVLSFPLKDRWDSSLGEIIISLETADRQKEGQPLSDEVLQLFVHGLLHLLGYDHETEEDSGKMRPLERMFLYDDEE
ncbi:MAG TPA: rRNA maturation RNase YbeY [Candidatus Mcinerneyibacteriales bacterium]|jgi:probable rRNA maturation factor|nr:rRNA maturation RNase YbeY [Candidatus Mcinerneyibacteriales bacterium]HPE19726.1 rRNA maturation RNase YbeY [Candidatus Mcinerneyibacteriales bacterium]HPQ89267.1 rRNA maturation RNase YbeY [Candidatus Mcinerneyibacteriales bacterium]